MQYTPAEQPAPPTAATGLPSLLSKRRRLIIVGIVLLAAFGYFGFTAFQAATSFYLTVDELVAQGPTAGKSVRVVGALVEGSFTRESTENTIATFQLHRNGAQIAATHDGVVPDLFFNPHSEIVLEGAYEPGGVFMTDRVLVKCASKYQSLEGDSPYDYYEDPSAAASDPT